MSLTLSRKKWIKSFIACTVALGGNLAYAQHTPIVTAEGSGHSGGGKVTESDFRAYMSKIDQFLQTSEGAAVFPEIVEFDKQNPKETFHDIIMNTKPSVKPGKLFDENGEERDCMSFATPTFRYFVCNSDALPEKTLNNQPSFYRIVLHELLVQAGLEVPISKAVPSDYKISYRITENVHLETYQEYVPGAKPTSGSYYDPGEALKFLFQMRSTLDKALQEVTTPRANENSNYSEDFNYVSSEIIEHDKVVGINYSVHPGGREYESIVKYHFVYDRSGVKTYFAIVKTDYSSFFMNTTSAKIVIEQAKE